MMMIVDLFFSLPPHPALLCSLIIRRISSGECTPVTTGGCGFHLFPCYLFPSSLQDEEDLSAGAVFGCPLSQGALGLAQVDAAVTSAFFTVPNNLTYNEFALLYSVQGIVNKGGSPVCF